MATKKRTPEEFTVFEAGSSFRGILEFERPLRILGRFEGEIRGKGILEIGAGAVVQARIIAEEVTIFGNVEGNIVAETRISLKNGARLVGNVKAPALEIDEGVIFEGLSEMQQIAG